jgi:hypothetical protein
MDVLEPVRDIAVGEILESLAESLDRGLDVRTEPKQRTPQGGIAREGRLALPRRCDLLVRRREGDLVRQVRSEKLLRFEPVTLVEPDGFVCVITPFRWDAALVVVTAGALTHEPDWGPVRRWYLEWFQSRFTDEAPDLDGSLHRLSGPETLEDGWRFELDLGSAPVEALSDMIGAFAATGVARIRIGDGGCVT